MHASERDAILTLDRLGKDFGTKTALTELSFSLYPGEVVCLLGPNGAGKTTTMRLILGLLRPTRGRASAFGLDCTQDAERVKASLGYTQDEPVFYDSVRSEEERLAEMWRTERSASPRPPVSPASSRLAPRIGIGGIGISGTF